MTDPVHPAIRRYAAGELTAMQAATELGEPASVADVIVMLRQAGLHPPEPPIERQRAELAHAMRVLGISPKPDRDAPTPPPAPAPAG